MSSSALTLEALFGDLNLEMGLPPQAIQHPPEPELALDEQGFTPASVFLSDSTRQRTGCTVPYEVPETEFAQSVMLWGDDERSTTPVLIEELPEEAYPPRFTLIEPDDLFA